MKIPKEFKLAGITWKVLEDPMMIDSAFGFCRQSEACIYLNPSKTISREMREQTFLHELVHSIMYAMGKSTHDEEFVDVFSAFLHQYLKSAK